MSHGISGYRGGATWWPVGAVAPSRIMDNLTRPHIYYYILFLYLLTDVQYLFFKTHISNLMIGLDFVVDGNKTLKTTF